MALRIAIDTGGTFTDLVAYDEDAGRMWFHKVASTPDDPGRALVRGVSEVTTKAGASHDAIALLVHGTTVATNAVLQRRGAKAALITTSGFRDVLHIQRQDRPRLYDMRSRRADPLVPRSRRYELTERITYDGQVQTPIDHQQLDELIAQLKADGVDAIAVGLLHSYANAAHEVEVGKHLRAKMPDATVCLSHELVQEHGEYERFSTCAMNAFVQPVMQRYLEHIDAALSKERITAPLFVMKSNGGVMEASLAGRQCVQTILSGPAGGVVAGAAIARQRPEGQRNLITADMGGTSYDVAVIHEGKLAFAREAEMAGLALKVPMLDIHTVGAGGGSIGWVDAGGSLRVGPHSAGADPGPACYGLGGKEPTVTDANLVLGRLAAKTLLGGGMTVDVEAARRAIHDTLAGPLKLSIEHAAEGMIRVVVATMTAATRKLTVERGHDPRHFALCPFGGAGPLHGSEIAREMGISETIVPLAPGVTSAVGLLMSHLREDRVRTEISLLKNVQLDRLRAIMRELEAEGAQRLKSAVSNHTFVTTRTLGLRYLGQGFELPVKLAGDRLDPGEMARAFHAEHQRLYGYCREDQPVELVNVWVSIEVDLGAVELPKVNAANTMPHPIAARPVVFAGKAHDTPVYARHSLGAGLRFTGPAIVEQLDATTVLWPGQTCHVDPFGQLILGAMHG